MRIWIAMVVSEEIKKYRFYRRFLDYELIKTIRVPYVGGDQEVENVGLQTWRASLLLAEYVHFNSDLFIGTHILELGAGLVF